MGHQIVNFRRFFRGDRTFFFLWSSLRFHRSTYRRNFAGAGRSFFFFADSAVCLMASETTLLSAQFYVVFETIAHVLCVELFRLFRSTSVADDAFFFTDSA